MATNITIPTVGESVTSGVISRWVKNSGDYVKRDETVLELETDKVTMEIPAPAAGVLTQQAKQGDEVPIGAVVGSIDETAAKPKESSKSTASDARAATTSSAEAKANGSESAARGATATADTPRSSARATPLARKLAADMGVDLDQIEGTGAGHRIREDDVLAFAKSRGTDRTTAASPSAPGASATTSPTTPPTTPPPPPRGSRGVTRERMSPLRQRIAQRLVAAQHTAAMLTTFNECDMTAVTAARTRYKEDFEKRHGVGLGFMSFFVTAAVNALRAFPLVNAAIVSDEKGAPAIEKHDYIDIAMAVSSPKGLVVPVIRDCQDLSFAQIETAVKDLAIRARDGKLTLEEMQGGTFTITNGGIFGSLMSTPILNPPQAAILGMHAIKNRAVEDPTKPGQVAIRPMMYLALSYDHRLIDGAEAVRFLVSIKNSIEDPQRLLLSL